MARRSSLADRHGASRSREAILVAAVVAAHGGSTASRGFRLSDVRFFFFLFSNWLEQDVLHATETLELTQVRRLLTRLVSRGWARTLGTRQYALTAAGLAGLVEEMTADLEASSFEEALFVVCFAECYRAAIVARAPPSRRKAIAEQLSSDRLLRIAERRVERVVSDLDERVRSSEAMQREARTLRRAGTAESAIAIALDRRDAYQLQHVRGFAEVLRGLPPDLLRFELDEGLGLRSELLFAPMAAVARAQRTILGALRANLRASAREDAE
jgi:hypothetical protein